MTEELRFLDILFVVSTLILTLGGQKITHWIANFFLWFITLGAGYYGMVLATNENIYAYERELAVGTAVSFSSFFVLYFSKWGIIENTVVAIVYFTIWTLLVATVLIPGENLEK